ncbi:MAG: TRAP transporter small permease subunit [Pseudomonadota bacterium]
MASRSILSLLDWVDRLMCAAGFIIISAALILDAGSRIFFGSGVLGAPQVGVIGMIAVAMFGTGLATTAGEHLRPTFLDGIWPAGWSGAVDRIADMLTGLFFFGIAGLALMVTVESYALEDVTNVLRWPIWPLQSMIALAFAANGVRYAIYAAEPQLHPRAALVEGAG